MLLSRAGALASLALAISVARAGTLSFVDATADAGVACSHGVLPGVLVIPMVPGAAAGDFNNDGWQDLFVITGGATPDRLFINNGDGTFSERAAEWGVAYAHVGAGAAVGDFDRDGWLDIYVTSFGPTGVEPGRHLLYRNNGDGTFSDVAVAAGVNRTAPSRADAFGASFGDYDLDGDLDLAVAGWVSVSGGNRLFRNNGDGTFDDVTATALDVGLYFTHGFSPRFADMDNDRWPELLWVADYGGTLYFRNERGLFHEHTAAAGVGLESNGMGQALGDFNADGLLDWYVTSIYNTAPTGQLGNMLYLNQGGHVFVERGAAAGVNDGGWGWGALADDLDLDGRLDIVETNGWSNEQWQNERCYVYMNNGDGTFDDVAGAVGVGHDGQGRGLLALDLDNDGDRDLVVLTMGGPLTLYRNDVAGPGANWLRVFLDTRRRPDLAPNGFGARVTVQAGGAAPQMRYLDGGCGYLSQSELSAHFGLGAAPGIDELRVDWPNGRTDTFRDIAVNQTLTVAARLRGDLDDDGDVDLVDILALLGRFGYCEASPAFDPTADLDGDGCVGLEDLAEALADFGLSGT